MNKKISIIMDGLLHKRLKEVDQIHCVYILTKWLVSFLSGLYFVLNK